MSFIGDIFNTAANKNPMADALKGPAALAGLGIGARNAFRGNPAKGINAFGGTTPGHRFGSQLSADGRSVNSFLERRDTLANREFDARFPRALSDISGLQSEVRPGFGRLTEAAVTGINNARSRAVGNIRDQLSRRRTLGSSFGQDTLARTEREFGEAEVKARAEGVLGEINASSQLIKQEADLIFQGVQRELQELQLGQGFATSMGQLITNNMQFEQQMEANRIAGQAAFGGALAGFGLSEGGSGGSGIFGGGGSMFPSGVPGNTSVPLNPMPQRGLQNPTIRSTGVTP